jgi:hypothetical protein
MWLYKAECRVFRDLLLQRWRDVPNWHEWDPDIETSSLQVSADDETKTKLNSPNKTPVRPFACGAC